MTAFFVVFLSVVAALHVYIGWRLIPAPRLESRGKKAAWALVAFSAASIPATLVLGRYVASAGLLRVVPWVGFTCLGAMGILAGLLIARDVALLGARVVVTDPGRRELLRRASAVGVLGAGGALIVEGLVEAARPPLIERVRVPIENLPAALRGFRLVQLSDTHLGPTLGRAFLADAVRRANELRPDVIAFTGDLADGFVANMRDEVAPLRDLRARHGVYFVTGNHEYYWRPDEWIPFVRELGLEVLENEHRLLDVGGATLALGGVPDAGESRRANRESDAVRAFAGAGRADVKILLAHRPESLYSAQRAGVDLQVCGHTHGGQVFPMNLLVHLAHPIVAGLGRFDRTWVYVNRGTAYWGPPLRTGGAGEITLVELEQGVHPDRGTR